MRLAASGALQADVRVWHAHTDCLAGDDDRTSRALGWLTPAERDRYARYRFDPDRAMFLLGRVMAKHLVGDALGVGPTAWTWREAARGRPEVDGETDVTFNLAHSAGVVVCAVRHGGHIGVDVEDRHRRELDKRLVARFCAQPEVDDITANGAWSDRFLEYWTLKESYLKARGVGIGVPLAEVCFDLRGSSPTVSFSGSLTGTDARWAFALRALSPRHIVAVAASVEDNAHPTYTFEPLPESSLP